MHELLDVFPEAKFLWCIRPAGPNLDSIREYYYVTGLQPPYGIVKALNDTYKIASVHPEIFDCIYTPSIPEWESDRVPVPRRTAHTKRIDELLDKVRGTVRNVASRSFKDLYS